MIILIVGTTAIHHTLVTAHFYLHGPENVDPNLVLHQGNLEGEGNGLPLLIGIDGQGNRVYTLGLGLSLETGFNALHDFYMYVIKDPTAIRIFPVRIPGEKIVWFLSHFLPWEGWASSFNSLVCKIFISPRLAYLREQAVSLNSIIAEPDGG